MTKIKKYQIGGYVVNQRGDTLRGKAAVAEKARQRQFEEGVIKENPASKIKPAVKSAVKAAPKKKAQAGVQLNTSQYKRLGRLRAKNPAKAERVGERMVERATRSQRGKDYIKSHQYELMPKSRNGSKLTKAKMGCANCGKTMKKK